MAEAKAALSPETFLATRTVQERIHISRCSGSATIVSASGMATGGRDLHHLRKFGEQVPVRATVADVMMRPASAWAEKSGRTPRPHRPPTGLDGGRTPFRGARTRPLSAGGRGRAAVSAVDEGRDRGNGGGRAVPARRGW
ncbi:hypothetical protein ACWEN3_01690 [Streptomyces sp. NPDC004561]